MDGSGIVGEKKLHKYCETRGSSEVLAHLEAEIKAEDEECLQGAEGRKSKILAKEVRLAQWFLSLHFISVDPGSIPVGITTS